MPSIIIYTTAENYIYQLNEIQNCLINFYIHIDIAYTYVHII